MCTLIARSDKEVYNLSVCPDFPDAEKQIQSLKYSELMIFVSLYDIRIKSENSSAGRQIYFK